MANPLHVEIIYQGVDVWNQWRQEHISIDTDLSGTNLAKFDLYEVNFDSTDLKGADLTEASLREANISYADFTAANLTRSLSDLTVAQNYKNHS